jgi:hypothetical protein
MVLFSNTFMVSLEVWTEFVLSGPWPKDPYSPACEVSVWLVDAQPPSRSTLTPAERQTLLAWQRATTIAAGRSRRGRIIVLVADRSRFPRLLPPVSARLWGRWAGALNRWC